MAQLVFTLFLLIFGLNLWVGLSIPTWLIGLLAFVATVLLVRDYFRVRVDGK